MERDTSDLERWRQRLWKGIEDWAKWERRRENKESLTQSLRRLGLARVLDVGIAPGSPITGSIISLCVVLAAVLTRAVDGRTPLRRRLAVDGVSLLSTSRTIALAKASTGCLPVHTRLRLAGVTMDGDSRGEGFACAASCTTPFELDRDTIKCASGEKYTPWRRGGRHSHQHTAFGSVAITGPAFRSVSARSSRTKMTTSRHPSSTPFRRLIMSRRLPTSVSARGRRRSTSFPTICFLTPRPSSAMRNGSCASTWHGKRKTPTACQFEHIALDTYPSIARRSSRGLVLLTCHFRQPAPSLFRHTYGTLRAGAGHPASVIDICSFVCICIGAQTSVHRPGLRHLPHAALFCDQQPCQLPTNFARAQYPCLWVLLFTRTLDASSSCTSVYQYSRLRARGIVLLGSLSLCYPGTPPRPCLGICGCASSLCPPILIVTTLLHIGLRPRIPLTPLPSERPQSPSSIACALFDALPLPLASALRYPRRRLPAWHLVLSTIPSSTYAKASIDSSNAARATCPQTPPHSAMAFAGSSAHSSEPMSSSSRWHRGYSTLREGADARLVACMALHPGLSCLPHTRSSLPLRYSSSAPDASRQSVHLDGDAAVDTEQPGKALPLTSSPLPPTPRPPRPSCS
ncbi:hypothetical protein MVEN_00013900 [Mycena venus]|uniref:Uncharacterized protein n=1 Tax=Mycena venus TaxID=2733690 RepID=A0A8H6Z9C7_9AGAR|nr:hypothetical protein MVEN_00013900 [Mycena venus]